MEPVMQLKLVATARDDPDEVNLSGKKERRRLYSFRFCF